MADLSDVEDALTSLVSSALYPDGIELPSLLDTTCRVYRGWPSSSALNADLMAGYVNVTVSPDTALGTTTTRFSSTWHSQRSIPELLVGVSGNTVLFDGNVQVGQLVGLLINGKGYMYSPLEGDTTQLVAANLGSQIAQDHPVQVVGAMISVPWASSLKARVVMHAPAYTEVRRQERDLRVIVWCPSSLLRDKASGAVDISVAKRTFMDLRDSSQARITYGGSAVFDQAQNAQLYRRDLIYRVEYPTIITENLPAMLFGTLNLNAAEFVA
jgi:hypothetical protein